MPRYEREIALRSSRNGRPIPSWVPFAAAAGLAFTAGFGAAGATFYYFGTAGSAPPIEIAASPELPPSAGSAEDQAELSAGALFTASGQDPAFAGPFRTTARTAAGDAAWSKTWALARLDPDSPDHAAAAPERLLPPEEQILEIEVQKGDTLLDIMMRAGAVEGDAHLAIAALKAHYDPRQLRVGAQLSIEIDGAASDAAPLKGLTIPVAFAEELKISRNEDGGFDARKVQLTLDRESILAAGPIRGSLYDSARAAGLPAQTIMRFVKLLSWDVDFQRDLHEGDQFEVLYDRLSTAGGRASQDGEMSFARLVTGGRDLALYRFEGKDGTLGWYDEKGKSIRKSLLRTPIDGARLSSGYGMRRHPVLGYSRMHKGIDFAAPTGTPIYAAGDGIIEVRGRNRGYGNYVRIKHNGEYATAYAHMSRFAKSQKVGSKVRQGEVIGYVGSTGLSTGPHLHYEILHKGSQINPTSVRQAVVDELAGAELARFKAERARIDGLRKQLAEPTLVAQK